MQHAGDAVWQIWGLVHYLNKVGQPILAAHIQKAATLIGEHIHVAPPDAVTLGQLSSALENLQATADDLGYAAERQQDTGEKHSGKYSDPELVAAAKSLVDEMVGSEQFEWADLVTSVAGQLEEKEFVTPKQCRALKNIANGRKSGDEGTFWEWFADENPVAAERVTVEADKA